MSKPEPTQLQLSLPHEQPIKCRRCDGRGDVYFLRLRPTVEVLGGKRKVCPECNGAGVVLGVPT